MVGLVAQNPVAVALVGIAVVAAEVVDNSAVEVVDYYPSARTPYLVCYQSAPTFQSFGILDYHRRAM